ncbi:MAG: hypothetical protein R3B93_00975 [Bacteroidia bacterium]
MQHLKNIYLEGNPISEIRMDSLRKMLPNCEISPKSRAQIRAENMAKNQWRVKRLEIETNSWESKLLNFQTIDSTQAAQSYNSLGWYQLLTGRFAEAEVSIRRGIELDSNYPFLHKNLPPSLLLQGKTEMARQSYLQWKDKYNQER